MAIATILDNRQFALDNGVLTLEEWDRWVERIVRANDMSRERAEQLADQAIALHRLLAANPEGVYAPSEPVDLAVDQLVLDTELHDRFTEALAKRKLHHAPADGADTTQAMMRAIKDLGNPEFKITRIDSAWIGQRAGDCTASGGGGR